MLRRLLITILMIPALILSGLIIGIIEVTSIIPYILYGDWNLYKLKVIKKIDSFIKK